MQWRERQRPASCNHDPACRQLSLGRAEVALLFLIRDMRTTSVPCWQIFSTGQSRRSSPLSKQGGGGLARGVNLCFGIGRRHAETAEVPVPDPLLAFHPYSFLISYISYGLWSPRRWTTSVDVSFWSYRQATRHTAHRRHTKDSLSAISFPDTETKYRYGWSLFGYELAPHDRGVVMWHIGWDSL